MISIEKIRDSKIEDYKYLASNTTPFLTWILNEMLEVIKWMKHTNTSSIK